MDEAMRFRIHGRFEELLGTEEAAALMSSITETSRFEARFDQIETEIREVRSEINQLYRWTVGSIFAAMSLGIAASHLVG